MFPLGLLPARAPGTFCRSEVRGAPWSTFLSSSPHPNPGSLGQNKSRTCLPVRETSVRLSRGPPSLAGVLEACVKASGPAAHTGSHSPAELSPRTEQAQDRGSWQWGWGSCPCHIPLLQPHSNGPAPHTTLIAHTVIFLVPARALPVLLLLPVLRAKAGRHRCFCGYTRGCFPFASPIDWATLDELHYL